MGGVGAVEEDFDEARRCAHLFIGEDEAAGVAAFGGEGEGARGGKGGVVVAEAGGGLGFVGAVDVAGDVVAGFGEGGREDDGVGGGRLERIGIDEPAIFAAEEAAAGGFRCRAHEAGIGGRLVGDEGGRVAPAVDHRAILRPALEGLFAEGGGFEDEGHIAAAFAVEFDLGGGARGDGAGGLLGAVEAEGIGEGDAGGGGEGDSVGGARGAGVDVARGRGEGAGGVIIGDGCG